MYFIFTADLDKRKKRLLNEAEHNLLDAEKGLEDATAIREMCKKRVLRLQKEVEQVIAKEQAAIEQKRSRSEKENLPQIPGLS
jgi:hypothetical protein